MCGGFSRPLGSGFCPCRVVVVERWLFGTLLGPEETGPCFLGVVFFGLAVAFPWLGGCGVVCFLSFV